VHKYYPRHEIKGFVIIRKSLVKIGRAKIFCYNNKMFSSINKTFGCNRKKYLFIVPFCCRKKTIFIRGNAGLKLLVKFLMHVGFIDSKSASFKAHIFFLIKAPFLIDFAMFLNDLLNRNGHTNIIRGCFVRTTVGLDQ